MLQDSNRVYALPVASANWYHFFEAQGHEFEPWCAFVKMRFRVMADAVCRNLRVRVMVSLVDGLVLNCTVMCLRFNVRMSCRHRGVFTRRYPNSVGSRRHSVLVG